MDKVRFIIFFLISMPMFVFSQDKLYKTDGTKLEVSIKEIGINNIKYKMFNNPEGPDYIILKDDVLLIEYANGSTEVFKPKQDDYRQKIQSTRPGTLRNILTLNMVQLLYSNFAVGYERKSENGILGIKIPVSVGFAKNNGHYYYNEYSSPSVNKVYSVGLDFNFYPYPARRLSYFLGPAAYYGKNRYSTYSYGIYGYSGTPKTYETQCYSFMVNNGLLFQPVANFVFSTSIGLGISKTEDHNANYYYYNNLIYPRITLDFCLGFKF